MTFHVTPLDEAAHIHSHLDQMDPDDREKAAESLAEWGTFSARQIAGIAGISREKSTAIAKKADRSGGRLVPGTLASIVDIRNHREREGVTPRDTLFEVVASGTSVDMIARLTGAPVSSLRRQYEKHAKALGCR